MQCGEHKDKWNDDCFGGKVRWGSAFPDTVPLRVGDGGWEGRRTGKGSGGGGGS